MTTNYQSIKDYDPDLWEALKGELDRQEDHPNRLVEGPFPADLQVGQTICVVLDTPVL